MSSVLFRGKALQAIGPFLQKLSAGPAPSLPRDGSESSHSSSPDDPALESF